jgi:hypothetical protein
MRTVHSQSGCAVATNVVPQREVPISNREVVIGSEGSLHGYKCCNSVNAMLMLE